MDRGKIGSKMRKHTASAQKAKTLAVRSTIINEEGKPKEE